MNYTPPKPVTDNVTGKTLNVPPPPIERKPGDMTTGKR